MLSADLRTILRGVLAALGVWRLEALLAVVVYRRIGRAMGRMARILVRFRTGRLRCVARRGPVPGRRVRAASAGLALPRRFGWLVQAGGHQAACFGLQLQAVLNTPEMSELLAASAQARRILRPICRSLAVELPGASRAVATNQAETTRRRTRPRAEPVPFRISLPRGVIAAARREGFGKDR